MGAEQPNILLVMTDQQKADTLGIYGNAVTRTPAIDSLAASGVVVDQAVCNYPACTPGRAAVMTGRYPHTTRVRANHLHLPAEEITLPDVLRRAGYTTALFGKNHVFADGGPVSQFRVGGLALHDWPRSTVDVRADFARLASEVTMADRRNVFDAWIGADHFGPHGPEFADVREFSLQPWLWRSSAASGPNPFTPDRCSSGFLGDRAAAFVRDRAASDDGPPWFAWLSFPDPHNPYNAPEPFASMYDPAAVTVPPVDSLDGKPERQRIARHMNGMDVIDDAVDVVTRKAIAVEWGMVTAIDAAVVTVLDALRETGADRNTIVVFTTDHGGYTADHGAWHKAPAFYDCLIRIPLVISWPGTLAPARLTGGFVEQVDLLPTLLDLAGLPTPPGVQGMSAAAALAGAAPPPRTTAFSEVGEAGTPVSWADLPFHPDSPLDDRWFPWDGFQETWIGQGKMVRTANWKYAWYANGDEELYDLAVDPDELMNLASEHRHVARKAAMRDRLLAWTVETEDQLPLHAGNIYLG